MEDLHAVVGVVGKPVGLRGEVYVRPDPDVGEPFAAGRTYRAAGGARKTLTVAASRLHAGRRVVRFEGIEDRAGAETLRGLVLTLPRGEVPVDEETFWSAELLGREVVDDDGTLLGVVEATADGTAHDYLVVARPDGGEVLVPAVADLLEITAERVVVHTIPGLLDLE